MSCLFLDAHWQNPPYCFQKSIWFCFLRSFSYVPTGHWVRPLIYPNGDEGRYTIIQRWLCSNRNTHDVSSGVAVFVDSANVTCLYNYESPESEVQLFLFPFHLFSQKRLKFFLSLLFLFIYREFELKSAEEVSRSWLYDSILEAFVPDSWCYHSMHVLVSTTCSSRFSRITVIQKSIIRSTWSAIREDHCRTCWNRLKNYVPG